MKKVLIGCGIIALFLFLLVVGISIFAYLKLRNIGSRYTTAVEEVHALNTRHPYTPPADEALDENRLAEYFEVREAILVKAQSNPTIQKITGAPESQPADVGFGEMMGLVTSFGPELIHTFASELDARQMSPIEYQDTVERIYATVRSGADNGDPDMTEIYESLNRVIEQMNVQLAKNNNPQHQVDFEDRTSDYLEEHPVPQSNYEILAQYKDELTEDPFITFIELFGLAQIEQQGAMRNRASGTLPTPVPATQ